jgi:hypothetical protein
MIKFLATIVSTILLTVATARAQNYLHNGSVMEITRQGAEMYIKYEQPRKDLVALGFQPGGLLFEGGIGKKTGDIGGTAYLFHRKCGSFPYSVAGSFSNGMTILILKGLSPIVDSKTCHVTKYTSAGPNANLKFTIFQFE